MNIATYNSGLFSLKKAFSLASKCILSSQKCVSLNQVASLQDFPDPPVEKGEYQEGLCLIHIYAAHKFHSYFAHLILSFWLSGDEQAQSGGTSAKISEWHIPSQNDSPTGEYTWTRDHPK